MHVWFFFYRDFHFKCRIKTVVRGMCKVCTMKEVLYSLHRFDYYYFLYKVKFTFFLLLGRRTLPYFQQASKLSEFVLAREFPLVDVFGIATTGTPVNKGGKSQILCLLQSFSI